MELKCCGRYLSRIFKCVASLKIYVYKYNRRRMCGRNQRGRPKFDVVALETVARGNNDWWHWMFRSIWHLAGDANILVRHLIEGVGLRHICLKLITKQNASFVTKYSNKKSKLIANEYRSAPSGPKNCRLCYSLASSKCDIYIHIHYHTKYHTHQREHRAKVSKYQVPKYFASSRADGSSSVSAVLGPKWR